jgi:hypothetical protein
VKNLSSSTKLQRVSNAVAAGTTAINSSVVDTARFEGVLFLVMMAAIVAGAVTSIKLQHGDAADLSDAADLEGTSVAVADSDDNKIVYLDVKRPLKRYVRVVVSRATQNAAIDGIVAIGYGAGVIPPTHDVATVAGGEVHVGPAEGTA